MNTSRRKKKNKRSERTRNILMVLFALTVIVIFFNLDFMRKGESIFSRTADQKLNFTGDLKRKSYSKSEVARLLKYIKRNNKIIEKATIETTLQDTYKKVTGKSQLIFEVHLEMADGATITTPTRRTTRTRLVDEVLAKMSKDIRAYRKLIKEGKKVKSLVNTM